MLNAKFVLILIPSILFWALMIPRHRHLSSHDRLRSNLLLSVLAGTKNTWLNARVFAFQLGYVSIIGWYILFSALNVGYFQKNAHVLSVVSGLFTIVFFRLLFQYTNRKQG